MGVQSMMTRDVSKASSVGMSMRIPRSLNPSMRSLSAAIRAPRLMRASTLLRSVSSGVFLWKITSSSPSWSLKWQRSPIRGSPMVPVPTTRTFFVPRMDPPEVLLAYPHTAAKRGRRDSGRRGVMLTRVPMVRQRLLGPEVYSWGMRSRALTKNFWAG